MPAATATTTCEKRDEKEVETTAILAADSCSFYSSSPITTDAATTEPQMSIKGDDRRDETMKQRGESAVGPPLLPPISCFMQEQEQQEGTQVFCGNSDVRDYNKSNNNIDEFIVPATAVQPSSPSPSVKYTSSSASNHQKQQQQQQQHGTPACSRINGIDNNGNELSGNTATGEPPLSSSSFPSNGNSSDPSRTRRRNTPIELLIGSRPRYLRRRPAPTSPFSLGVLVGQEVTRALSLFQNHNANNNDNSSEANAAMKQCPPLDPNRPISRPLTRMMPLPPPLLWTINEASHSNNIDGADNGAQQSSSSPPSSPLSVASSTSIPLSKIVGNGITLPLSPSQTSTEYLTDDGNGTFGTCSSMASMISDKSDNAGSFHQYDNNTIMNGKITITTTNITHEQQQQQPMSSLSFPRVDKGEVCRVHSCPVPPSANAVETTSNNSCHSSSSSESMKTKTKKKKNNTVIRNAWECWKRNQNNRSVELVRSTKGYLS